MAERTMAEGTAMRGNLCSVDRLNADESMSTTTPRGWPSSSYFIRGISPAPRPVNMQADKTPDEASKSEDEEKGELSGPVESE